MGALRVGKVDLETKVNNRRKRGSTYRSLLRRQLEVSLRPPSPPSRCHISKARLDPMFYLRSISCWFGGSNWRCML